MTLRRQKVTEQGKMCMFSTKIIENRALQYLRIMKNFPAVIGSTRLQLQLQQSFLHYVPMAWRNVIELTINWDNQNQQANSFQMTSPNWSTKTTKP